MTEDNVKSFLNQHKEAVTGDIFNARLFNALDYLPQPTPRKSNAKLIVGVSTGIGILLFVVLGGYGILLYGFASIGQLFVSDRMLTPEVMTTCFMLALALVALACFTVHSYHR